MDQLRQDIRVAARMVWKNPGYAIVAVLALALGIGANTAIFSVADALVWKPIPIPGIERAVVIQELDARKQADELSPANYLDLRQQTRTLEHVAAYEWETLNLTGTGEPERVQGISVTPVEDRSELDSVSAMADPEKSVVPELGILGVEIDRRIAAAASGLRDPYGVIVVARAAGASTEVPLQRRDIIRSVNNQQVSTLQGLKDTMHALKPGAATTLQIQREGRLMFVSFTIE